MTTDASLSLGRRWGIFLHERFPLTTNVPMAALFAITNMGLAVRAAGGKGDLLRMALGLLLALSFLFRLRCFDEIKDYATDLHLNPERPLPRGILTLRQVKTIIAALTIFEIALVAYLGWPVLVTHLIAVGYSFLMYREFFIGKFLRPRLTAYAVTHTFSSVLLGWSLASLATGLLITRLPWPVLLFGLANWMLFNIFEFARKSFAVEEETPDVDSYSSLYRPWGAVVLTMSQVIIAMGVLWRLPANLPGRTAVYIEMALAAGVLLTGVTYAAKPRTGVAKIYRTAASLFILLFYVVLAWGVWI